MKARLQLWGKPQGYATVDTDATKGATLGVDLFRADGSIVTEADLVPPAAAGGDPNASVSRTLWSLIVDIPAIVASLVALATDGFVRKSGSALSASPIVTADLPDDGVTYAKMQNVSATARILGRKAAGAGDTQECTLSEVLDFVGSAANGDILIRSGGVWTRLPKATDGNFLKLVSGLPAWAASSGGGAWTNLGTATVGGSAVTSLALDLTATPLSGFKYFVFEFNFKNATGTAGTLALYLNSDSTATNYDRQTLSDINSSVVGARTNANVLATYLASTVVAGNGQILLDRNGKAVALFQASEGETTALQHRTGCFKYRTAADINFLTVTSSVANSLSPGDNFTVWGVS